jgi:hypothetical protein
MCNSTHCFYWSCGHITEQRRACDPWLCRTNDFPKICTEFLTDCEKCSDRKTKPFPPEVQQSLKAVFLLEKARYDQQLQDVGTEQLELYEVLAES